MMREIMLDTPETIDWLRIVQGMTEVGPGKGWWGPPGGTHVAAEGAKKIRLTRHAFNRTQERTGFGPVRRALKALARMEVPDEEWHTELYRSQGRLAGYLQGFDGRVKTVLGPWYEKGKLSSSEPHFLWCLISVCFILDSPLHQAEFVSTQLSVSQIFDFYKTPGIDLSLLGCIETSSSD